MPSVGDLVARLMLDASNFKAGIEQYGRDVKTAKDVNKDFQAGLDGISDTLMTVAEVGVAAGAAIFAIGKHTADTADEIDDLSKTTGISVEKLYELKYVGGVAGTSFDALSQSIRMYTVRMKELGADNDVSRAYQQLGIDPSQYVSKGEAFMDTLAALRNIQDEAQRTQLAFAIFGKSYYNMIDLISMSDDEWKKYIKNARDAGLVLSTELNKSLADSSHEMNEMGQQLEGVMNKMGQNFAPLIEKVVVPAVESLANAFSWVLEKAKEMGEGTMLNVLWVTGMIKGNLAQYDNYVAEMERKRVIKPEPSGAATLLPEASKQPWETWGTAGGGTKIPAYISPEQILKSIADGWKGTQQEIADHLKSYTSAIISNQTDDWKEKNKTVIDELNETIKRSFDITGTQLNGSADALMKAAINLEAAALVTNPYGAGTVALGKAAEAWTAAGGAAGAGVTYQAQIEQLYTSGQISVQQYQTAMGTPGLALSEGDARPSTRISSAGWAESHPEFAYTPWEPGEMISILSGGQVVPAYTPGVGQTTPVWTGARSELTGDVVVKLFVDSSEIGQAIISRLHLLGVQ